MTMNFPLIFKGLEYTVIGMRDNLYFTETGHVFKTFSDGEIELFKKPLFIIKDGRAIRLDYGPDELWRDHDGCIYALRETDKFIDEDPRCGVGFFSLPNVGVFKEWNRGCAPHDYKYQSPVYKMYHSEEEADKDLRRDLKSVGAPKAIAKLFYGIVHRVGNWFY